MPAKLFSKQRFRFLLLGVDLVRPINLITEGMYFIATNVRSYVAGIIQPRSGLTLLRNLVGAAGIGVHSIIRLNDTIAGTFAHIQGMGTLLFDGATQIDSGYSGNPLTFAIASPPQTPRSYCYIGDKTKMSKHKVGDAVANPIGIAPPTQTPQVNFGLPAYTVLETFDSAAGWTASGNATVPTVSARINTTVTAIAYDSGNTGWCSVRPADMTFIARGVILTIGAEAVLVQTVYPGATATTIAAIVYDSGVNGLCTIQLTAPSALGNIQKFTLMQINAEYVVVQDIAVGQDNIPSIRVSTSGTHSAGETVTGFASFRAFTNNTHAAAEAIVDNEIDLTVNGSGTGAQVTGTIIKPTTVDGSIANNRPIDPVNDEVHLSIFVSKLHHWQQATLILDVDISQNDATRNYYFKTLTASDFSTTDPTDATQTVNQARLTRLQNKLANATQAGDFDTVRNLQERIATLKARVDQVLVTPLDDQSALGDHQWHELRFKTKELFRVGTDYSRSLKDIKAIAVVFTVDKGRNFSLDSLWIGGTYGPDIGDLGQPYKYIYRYRSKLTGVTSAWSPPQHTGISPHKERVSITPVASPDPQCDTIDYARFGGVIPNWKIIGYGPNTNAPFFDDLDDTAIENYQDVNLNDVQPFAVIDLPRIGTCNVAGTAVSRVSGDTFNTSWIRNSVIIIDGVPCSLYAPPNSSGFLQLNESMGARNGVTFYMPQPVIAGFPLPSIFGPIGYGETGIFIFGVGDPNNPGTLYWCQGNAPDITTDTNNLVITNGSEILVNGIVFNGRAYLFSTERLYEIFPNFSSDSQFVVQSLYGSKGMLGLLQNTALCAGPSIWFRGKDGIYETIGWIPTNITDAELYPLFPHDGQPGTATNGYFPPDDTKPQNLRYYDRYLYYDYIDTNGNATTLVYNTLIKSWTFDQYGGGVTPLIHYGEDGSDVHSLLVGGITTGAGKVWTQSGTSDDGNPIAGHIRTGAFDAEEPRARKQFRDVFFDADPNNGTLNIDIGFDEYTALEANQTRTGNGRKKTPELYIQGGQGKLAYNEALDISWSEAVAVPKLYAWESSYIVKPEEQETACTDPDDLGTNKAKFVQGLRIHCNTLNQSKTFIVQSDTGIHNGIPADSGASGVFITQQTFTVVSNGESVIPLSFDTPFIAHLVRILTTDGVPWEIFNYEFEFNIEPDAVLTWTGQQTSLNQKGYQHLKGLQITHMSTANLSLTITIDGIQQEEVIIPNSNGTRLKTYVEIPAFKGKVFQFSLTSLNVFRLYLFDTEIRTKQWGTQNPYLAIPALGDLHYDRGVRM